MVLKKLKPKTNKRVKWKGRDGTGRDRGRKSQGGEWRIENEIQILNSIISSHQVLNNAKTRNSNFGEFVQ